MGLFNKSEPPEENVETSAVDPDEEPGLDHGGQDERGATKASAGPGRLGRLLKKRRAAKDVTPAPEKGKPGLDARDLVAVIRNKMKPSSPGDDARNEPRDSTGLEQIVSAGPADYMFDGDQVIRIGRRNVILGLLWDSFRIGESIKTQAADISTATATYNLVANFRDAEQVGFVEKGNGPRIGHKAGVTAFSEDRMGTSWVGAFHIAGTAETYWVVARRNGQVYEDQVIRGADEAKALFLENLEAPDWQRRIAPEDWDIGGTNTYQLQDVLEPHLGISLKPVDPVRTYLPRVVASTLLLLVGAGGYTYYQSHLQYRMEAMRELAALRASSVRVSPSDYPWYDTPSLPVFLEECYPGIEIALRDVPGWKQDAISCHIDPVTREVGVETSWINEGGTVPWMVAAFSPDETSPDIDLEGETAAYRRIVGSEYRTEGVAEPWEEQRVEEVLYRRIQTVRVDVSIEPRVTRMTPRQISENRSAVYNFHDVTFQTSGALNEYASLFADIPALVPVGMVYDVGAGSWNVNFRIYHPAILPN